VEQNEGKKGRYDTWHNDIQHSNKNATIGIMTFSITIKIATIGITTLNKMALKAINVVCG
jgi:hypothetical protein